MYKRKIKALRAIKGVTQKETAKRLGMKEISYVKRENEQIDFSRSEIIAFAKVFNLSSNEIIDIFFDDKVAFETTKLA